MYKPKLFPNFFVGHLSKARYTGCRADQVTGRNLVYYCFFFSLHKKSLHVRPGGVDLRCYVHAYCTFVLLPDTKSALCLTVSVVYLCFSVPPPVCCESSAADASLVANGR